MDLAHSNMNERNMRSSLEPIDHRIGWAMVDEEQNDPADRVWKSFTDKKVSHTSTDINVEEVRSRWGGTLHGLAIRDYDKAHTNSTVGWPDASLSSEMMRREATSWGMRSEVGEGKESMPVSYGLGGLYC